MKHILLFLLFVLSVVSLTARGQNQENVSDLRPVTVVLDWSVNTNHTGLYIALDKGYFTEEGLDVTVEFPPETGAESMVVAGKAELAFSYQEGVTYARAAGTPLTAVAAVIQHNSSGFASRVEEGITRPRDFEGKTYGGWGSPVEEAMLKALMEGDGGNPEKVKIVPIGSMDFFAATAGQIDFVWIFQGWDGVAANLKGIKTNYIPLAQEEVLDYYTPVLVTRDDLINEDPELIRSLLKAVSRGYEYAAENPEEAADILLKAAPELDEELVRSSQEFLGPRYQAEASRWGEMKVEVWTRYADWLSRNGLLEGEFDPAAAFTNEFLPD